MAVNFLTKTGLFFVKIPRFVPKKQSETAYYRRQPKKKFVRNRLPYSAFCPPPADSVEKNFGSLKKGRIFAPAFEERGQPRRKARGHRNSEIER